MGRCGGRESASERARACTHGREREKALWLLLLYVFSSTWACPMQIGFSQECCLFCLFCLKSSLWSSDLPCLLATAILDSFSLFYLPNTWKSTKFLNLGFPHSSVGKESAYNAGELGLIPGSGRSPGEGNGNPLQYSCHIFLISYASVR